MDFSQFSALAFFGALAIFIYGIRLTQAGIQLLAGDRLRGILSSLTDNRWLALGVGALITLILQSSGATIITLVGFVGSGLMNLNQAMGVMLGAGIGTTLVVFLLAIKGISTYSLLFLVLGVAVDLMRRSKRGRYVSMVLMGFGFIFFGMDLMVHVTSSLQNNPLLKELFGFLADRPWVAMIVSILLTVIMQNSAAPIGLAIALAFSGLLNLETALPIVLGANVGTCSSSVFASLGSSSAGKRTALANLLQKVIGAVLAMLLLKPFAESVRWFSNLLHPGMADSGQIAISHLLFNVYLVALFLPFLRPAALLIEKLLPDPHSMEEEKFRPRYLDQKSLEIPSLAFANVRREMLRMFDLDLQMFEDCLTVIDKSDRVLLEEIQNQDDQVDLLNREIKFFLAKLSQENLTPEQGDMELRLIEMTGTLEEIGDIINHNILDLADKKIRMGRKFSEGGWKELKDFHGRIVENFRIAAGSLTAEDETLARKLMRHNEQLISIERDYRQGHLNRLHQGLRETLETSSIHLDLLSNFYRINFLVGKLIRKAYPQLVSQV